MKYTVTLTEKQAQVVLGGLRLAESYASELKQHAKAQLFKEAFEAIEAQLIGRTITQGTGSVRAAWSGHNRIV